MKDPNKKWKMHYWQCMECARRMGRKQMLKHKKKFPEHEVWEHRYVI